MVPFIMAALNMAQQKAQNENAQNQQMAQNMQNAVNGSQLPQFQIPSINSVFGNY
jgi:hypothetical protein